MNTKKIMRDTWDRLKINIAYDASYFNFEYSAMLDYLDENGNQEEFKKFLLKQWDVLKNSAKKTCVILGINSQ
jgi:cobyrinic acid a,c-diamide synthase